MEQIEYLIKLGKSQGYLNFGDLREALPYDNIEEKDLKDIVLMLEGEGIKIKMTNAKIVRLDSKTNKKD